MLNFQFNKYDGLANFIYLIPQTKIFENILKIWVGQSSKTTNEKK